MNKKVKHPKLDPYFISLRQKYEITYIVSKFRGEGYIITPLEVRAVIKTVGKSRHKVYNFIRKNFSDQVDV